MKDLLAIIPSGSGKTLAQPGTYSLSLAARMGSHVTAIIAEIERFNSAAQLEPTICRVIAGRSHRRP